jgi:hypothetical protein
MLGDLDLATSQRQPRVSRYFHYPLHRWDFHELRVEDRPRGQTVLLAFADELC